jgi:hypothetical protein
MLSYESRGRLEGLHGIWCGVVFGVGYASEIWSSVESSAVESELEGILGAVAVGKKYRLRLQPPYKILNRY